MLAGLLLRPFKGVGNSVWHSGKSVAINAKTMLTKSLIFFRGRDCETRRAPLTNHSQHQDSLGNLLQAGKSTTPSLEKPLLRWCACSAVRIII